MDQFQLLQEFVDKCKKDRSLIHNPDLAFFKDYVESFGGTIPSPPAKESGEAKGCPFSQGSAESEEPKDPTPEEPSIPEPELDNSGVIEPDSGEPLPMGEVGKEDSSYDSNSELSPKWNKALSSLRHTFLTQENVYLIILENADEKQIDRIAGMDIPTQSRFTQILNVKKGLGSIKEILEKLDKLNSYDEYHHTNIGFQAAVSKVMNLFSDQSDMLYKTELRTHHDLGMVAAHHPILTENDFANVDVDISIREKMGDKSKSYTIEQREEAASLFKQAEFLYKNGNYEKALLLLDQIIGMVARSAEVHLLRSKCFVRLELPIAAIEDMEGYLRMSNGSVTASRFREEAYGCMNDFIAKRIHEDLHDKDPPALGAMAVLGALKIQESIKIKEAKDISIFVNGEDMAARLSPPRYDAPPPPLSDEM